MMDQAKLLLNEMEVNRSLQLTLKAYLAMKKKGRDDLAFDILGIGSRIARMRLEQLGIKSHKVFCPQCKEQIKNGKEIEYLNGVGYCFSCEEYN